MIVAYARKCIVCNTAVFATDKDYYLCKNHSGSGKIERLKDAPARAKIMGKWDP